jgi:hypothetical protein
MPNLNRRREGVREQAGGMHGQSGKLCIGTGAGKDLDIALVPCRADRLRLERTGIAQGGASTGQGIGQGYSCPHEAQASSAQRLERPGCSVVSRSGARAGTDAWPREDRVPWGLQWKMRGLSSACSTMARMVWIRPVGILEWPQLSGA